MFLKGSQKGAYSLLYIVAFAILVVVPQQVKAQKSTLRILVTSGEDGAPLIGANVILRNPVNDKIILAGATNKDGFVNYHNIDPNVYDLRVSYIGFKPYISEIRLVSDQVNIKRVALALANNELESVVVSASRNEEAGNAGIHNISRAEIARVPTPGAGGDLASYLQNVPGIISVGDRGGDFHVRGGKPNENKVLVDDIPLVKPFHISNLFSAFPDNVISNVDLYTGGFGAQYYGVTSAIIDVNLRPGNYKEYEASGSVGTYLTSFRAEGPIHKNTDSFLLMGRKSLVDQTSSFLSSDQSPTNFYDLTARYSLKKQNYRCNITALHTYDKGQINPAELFYLSWSNTAIGGRCLGFSERYSFPVEYTAGFSSFHNEISSKETTTRSSDLSTWYFSIEHKETILGLPTDYGVEITNRYYQAKLDDKFTDTQSFDNYSPTLYMFGSTLIEMGENFTVKPSLGFLGTFDDSFGIVPSLEPRIRLSYLPDGTQDQEISLAFGKYSQINTSLSDELDAGTNFRIFKPSSFGKPIQTALHGIASYSRQLGPYIKGKVEGYIKEYSNIQVSKFSPIAKLDVETIRADGQAYGIDFVAKYQQNPFVFSLGYGYSQVRYDADGESLGQFVGGDTYRRILSYNPAQDQRHKLNAQLSYEIAGFNTSVRWQYGSGKPYTKVYAFDLGLDIPFEDPTLFPGTARTLYSQPYGERLPSYHRLDISAAKTFHLGRNVDITTKFGALNVYDRRNIFYYDANSQQRIDQTPFLPYLNLSLNI